MAFTDLAEAEAWITEQFSAWMVALTDDERDALAQYKETAYEEINHELRAGIDDDPRIDSIDSALRRFRLQKPITVYRGLVDVADLRDGDEFMEYGFLSTSLIREIAWSFISHLDDDQCMRWQVTIPGGAAVGAFVGAPDVILQQHEAEILLPRETGLRVVRRSSTITEMEVILDE